MKKIIEVKDITLSSGDIYNSESYPSDGFYNVTDSDGMNPVQFYFVDNSAISFIGNCSVIDKFITSIEEIPEEDKEGMVSEGFALKMLAVSAGHTMKVDINEK